MRSLLLAATLLAAAPARALADDPPPMADWRQASLDDSSREALRGLGYRLEDNGKVLEPKARAALSPAQFAAILARLRLAGRRAALERLTLILGKDGPLSASDRASAAALKDALPPDVAKALDAGVGAEDLRRLTNGNLSRVAANFDGARTLAERREAALPVSASAGDAKVPLPYFEPRERALGAALRAAAARQLGRDPYGRALLARLNGADGKPDLPPIIVEDVSGGSVALYDYRRRAIVLDRENLLASIVGDVPPKDRAALRQKLSARASLIDYLNAHPEAAASLAASNDVVVFHELVHASQDRRDPVMREMARGNLPTVMILEYEEEAWTMKNLYLQSKLKRDPKSVQDDFELADYVAMNRNPEKWRRALYDQYRSYSPAGALTLRQVREVSDERRRQAQARAVVTPAGQEGKALDLLALGRARKELERARPKQEARLRERRGDVDSSAKEGSRLLGKHYLQKSLDAPNAVEFSVAVEKAEEFALLAGDRGLLARIRALKERRR